MTEKTGLNVPWASIVVVLAFVSSSLLAPRAFDPLRPAEKERVQEARGAELEVDARLWEDPFVAMRRHEAERLERCAKLKEGSSTRPVDCVSEQLAQRRAPGRFVDLLDRDADGDLDEALLIAALVPGNPFVGAEESRRRTRYAMLAGLQTQDYVPDNSDHIGLLRFRWRTQFMPYADRQEVVHELNVPYELLSLRPQLRGGEPGKRAGRYRQIALLWVDESALPSPKLDSLARVFHDLFAQRVSVPRLAVVGPSSSDALRVALADLKRASLQRDRLDAAVLDGYARLQRAQIVSPASTAPTAQLEELGGQRLEQFLADKLAAITRTAQPVKLDFRRTIATDNLVLRSLVDELKLRLPPQQVRRVVLVAERDSLYAQALVTELKYRMRDVKTLRFEPEYFFRGLDGVTTREGVDKPAADKNAKPDQAIEWPESRDQLDYLRRLAGALKDSEADPGRGPIGAIGILAFDVHDKLLVLQALHETFADKVFFTTDMDARYLHPRTLSFTRNLLVASSLPLAFVDPAPRSGGESLQDGVPPLRDVYQVSTYLAARRLGCRETECRKDEDAAADKALTNPSVYEIGRSRATPVAGYDFDARGARPPLVRAIVAAALVALLAAGLLVWPSTPALRRVRDTWLATPGHLGVRRHHAMLAALHFASLSFVLCSAIEFVNPGHVSLAGTLALAGVTAFAVLATLYAPRDPATTPVRPKAAARRSTRLRPRRVLVAALAGLVVGIAIALAWPSHPVQPCSECEPVTWLEGVSAWPSHLIHLVALIAIAWSLDQLWSDGVCSTEANAAWLGVARAQPKPGYLAMLRRKPLAWLARYTLAHWKHGTQRGNSFNRLWRSYALRGQMSARGLRILFWYGVTMALVAGLFFGFSEGYAHEVPVRGVEHRRLIAWTLYGLLLLLPLLVVGVADATMLTCRFVWHLNRCRTAYTPATLERFARALGEDEHRALWITPIPHEVCARSEPNAGASLLPHTLLDNWIDIEVVDRLTRSVATQITGPFVVLALLVVARSRLFDNWAVTLPIVLAALAYLAWLVLLALLLQRAVEQARRHAVANMREDLRWLAGAGRDPLIEPFKRLIEAVENRRSGAFAGFFEQPLFKALLVPLGGAGGAQLFDQLLLAR